MTKLTSTDLRGFSYFLAVAEEKTLAAAAARLHMAQPPLSVQIRKLEQRIGVSLFERSSTGMRLTEAGHALYVRARDAFRLAQDGFDAAIAIGRGFRGTLKVGIMHALCYEYLPSIVDVLRHDMPGVDFCFEELDALSVRSALQDRRIHVALSTIPSAHGSIASVDCGRIPCMAVVSDKKFAEPFEPISLERLADEPLILLPTAHEAGMAGVLKLFTDNGYNPTIAHRVQTVHGALALIKAGMGVAILPATVLAMLPSGVSVHPIDGVDYGVSIAASWVKEQPEQRAIDRFVQIIRPILASDPRSRARQ